ncbi:hypothetical protein CN203_27620 [Sinorhizobium meliloti]|uniref:hypothetical protein n=1 Tax=Rhizobium meliloti TaxID=382 RepID=UPI0002F684C6|nr:hypothetical protein [Sinorhizobium meliloti]RVH72556.1 hypothetical protein CN203_27620 [Sinorhizobium meliloti]
MSMIPDLSDRGLREQFGDILLELPELWDALRRFEIESRPAVTSGGFKMKADWVSVEHIGDETRIRIGDPMRYAGT